MKRHGELDPASIEQLATCAASWSGFTRGAIHLDSVRRAARDCLSQPMTVTELLARAASNDPRIVGIFRQAICVGETYFFRSPESFDFLMGTVLGPLVASGATRVRAWSAGCSTGEEAYSLAACLLAASRPYGGVSVEVLGTDLAADSLERARRAEYGAWSVRETAPIPLPLLETIGPGRFRVRDEARAVVRFALHDLLAPPPGEFGEFNVIFCRNVLVYFGPDAIEQASRRLAERLAPGGVMFFGMLEVSDPPPGLVPVGGPTITAFQRPLSGSRLGRSTSQRPRSRSTSRAPAPQAAKRVSAKPERARSVPPGRRSTRPPASSTLPSEIKARHLTALRLIEADRRREALDILSRIQTEAPFYVAALLDQALLRRRAGHGAAAVGLVREILRLTDAMPGETILPGVQELSVAYYRAAADGFLAASRRGR